jgi:hypothetical protein
MTGRAAFDIGLMEKISYQALTVTAMRIVTGEAVFEGKGVVFVGCLKGVFTVAGETQGIGLVGQKLQVVCLVGPVAGCTVAITIGFMGLFVLFLQVCMTPKTVFGEVFTDQTLFTTGVGGVTGAAFSTGNRRVNNTFSKCLFTGLVTGVTECVFTIT